MILIEKTMQVRFDDVAERARIEANFKGARRKLLLKILDAFVAADFSEAYKIILGMDRQEREYLNETLYDVIDGVHEQVTRQGVAIQMAAQRVASDEKPAFGYGFEGVPYPKFTVLAEGKMPRAATVPKLEDLRTIVEPQKSANAAASSAS